MELSIPLTEKTLTEAHLLQFSKESLVKLIIDNKKALIVPKKLHKNENQKPFDFSKH
jgi:hypothetical protein